jgi:NAD(P)-dependent dehydrogenase (short-subunit alcohol dehydrogenase family)
VQASIAERMPSASTELLIADLSLLAATRHVANLIVSRHPKITLLINNAGVFDAKLVMTAEGRDRVLATNLLSPFVLTQVLLPALRAGAPSRSPIARGSTLTVLCSADVGR